MSEGLRRHFGVNIISHSLNSRFGTKAKYDLIGAGDKQQEDEKRRSQLNKEYRIHQLRELGTPMFGELEDGTADPDDM